MRNRWIGILFTLLFLIFLITAARRLGAPFLDSHLFQLESKLLYIVLTSIAFGALLLFLLVTFFPPWTKKFETNISLPPAAPSRKLVQIQMALQLGDWRKAMDLLSKVRETDADYWYALKIKGDLHAEKGEWVEATKYYRNALNHSSGQEQAVLLLSLGIVFEQQDQIEQARDLYMQVLHSSPQSMEAIHRLRNLAVREQDWKEAMTWQEMKEQLFLQETETPQESNWKIGIRYELARSATQSTNYKTSQALLKYIFRLTDYFTPAYLLQAEIHEKQENSILALRTYEEGFLKTQSPAILKKIGETFLLQNLPQRAIELFREVVWTHPEDPRAAFCLGDLYRKLEMTEEATKIFEGIHQKHPDWLLNNITLAELCDRSGKKEQALQLYRGLTDGAEVLSAQPWQCYNCNTTHSEYSGFCIFCFEWNSINLNQNKAGTLDFGHEKSTALPL
ncbi:tetratricopeptide repeat protein [bacterium]|nr:tetratricopeptide repeat protein [bacterium]MCI0607116.1 tetratricopeptide repeat protein [bacterium]